MCDLFEVELNIAEGKSNSPKKIFIYNIPFIPQERERMAQRQSILFRSCGTLLVPFSLLLVIALLLYLHWDLRGRVSSLREELESVRQERDEVAVKAKHFEDEIKGALWEKRGCIEQKKSISIQLDKANDQLVSA